MFLRKESRSPPGCQSDVDALLGVVVQVWASTRARGRMSNRIMAAGTLTASGDDTPSDACGRMLADLQGSLDGRAAAAPPRTSHAARASTAAAAAKRKQLLLAAAASAWTRTASLLAAVALTVACHAVWAGVAAASGGGSFSLPTKLLTLNPTCDYKEVSSQLLSASAALLALAFFSLSETAITTLWPWKVRLRYHLLPRHTWETLGGGGGHVAYLCIRHTDASCLRTPRIDAASLRTTHRYILALPLTRTPPPPALSQRIFHSWVVLWGGVADSAAA